VKKTTAKSLGSDTWRSVRQSGDGLVKGEGACHVSMWGETLSRRWRFHSIATEGMVRSRLDMEMSGYVQRPFLKISLCWGGNHFSK